MSTQKRVESICDYCGKTELANEEVPRGWTRIARQSYGAIVARDEKRLWKSQSFRARSDTHDFCCVDHLAQWLKEEDRKEAVQINLWLAGIYTDQVCSVGGVFDSPCARAEEEPEEAIEEPTIVVRVETGRGNCVIGEYYTMDEAIVGAALSYKEGPAGRRLLIDECTHRLIGVVSASIEIFDPEEDSGE